MLGYLLILGGMLGCASQPIPAPNDQTIVPSPNNPEDSGAIAGETTPRNLEAEKARSAPAERTKPPTKDSDDIIVEGKKPQPAKETVLTVVPSGLNVRAGPGMRHVVRRVLKKGEKVKQLGQEGIWVKITNGEFVSGRYLSP